MAAAGEELALNKASSGFISDTRRTSNSVVLNTFLYEAYEVDAVGCVYDYRCG